MRAILLIVILFQMNYGFSQGFLEKTIQKDSAILDFEIFRDALLTGHPGIYWNKSEKDISVSFDIARQQITGDISNREFHKILTSVMNDISCGHSMILYPKSYTENIDTLSIFFPFIVSLINNRLYVTEDLGNSDVVIGSEILSINNKGIEEIIEIIINKIPIDKGIKSKAERSLNYLFSYYYSLHIEQADCFKIELLDTNGLKTNNVVNSIKWNNEKMFRSPREISRSRIPIRYKSSNNIAEIKIATFGNENFKEYNIDFADTINSIFKEIKTGKINNLVIDLRGNNGGSLYFGEILLSYLIERDIKFYENNVMSKVVAEGTFKYADLPHYLNMFEEEFGILKMRDNQYIIPRDSLKKNNFTFLGNVFFLADGLTFSATSNFLSVCQENDVGVVIGETPGGAYSGCNGGGPVNIELPNSHFRLFFYLIGIRLNVDNNKNEISTDHELHRNLNDVIKNNDRCIEKAYQIIYNK